MESRFFFNKRDGMNNAPGFIFRNRSKVQPVHTAILSDFFADIPDNLFCTNVMYSEFREDLESAVEIFYPKDRVVINLYERTPSDPDKRELVLIGFRKYINDCYRTEYHLYINQLVEVTLFALLGCLIFFLIYGLHPPFPEWILYIIDTFGAVLLWQFGGYWAFEHMRQKRVLDRLKQLASIEFHFRQWE